MMTLENISKSYGEKKILQDFSLKIENGEIFTLIGESGCGKTTLLRIIAGFEQPDAGEVFIRDKDILSLPVERRPVGFVFQNYALFPHLSVYDNIAVGPRVRKIVESEISKKIEKVMEITRLNKLKQALPQQLSGGEKQRVAIARAIVNQPEVLLLDEPFSALDPSLRQNLREELFDMQRQLDLTFLMLTHDQEEALGLSHRIGVLKDGNLQQWGPPEQLYKRPANPYVAMFLGSVNCLEGKVENQSGLRLWVNVDFVGKFVCESKIFRAPGSPITLYIRPENILISFKKFVGPSDNEIHGLMIKSSFRGHHTQYQIALKNGKIFQVLVPSGSEADIDEFPRLKHSVNLFLNPEHIFLLDEGWENEDQDQEKDDSFDV